MPTYDGWPKPSSNGDATVEGLEVFDPPMCCPTGVCGVDVDPDLVRFAADLAWLKAHGIEARRYNLSQEAHAFVGNAVVRRTLQERGTASLPLVFWRGEVVASGAYPERALLMRVLGLTAENDDAGVAS